MVIHPDMSKLNQYKYDARWPVSIMSNNQQPPEKIVSPYPSVSPPMGYSYPKSSIFKLNGT